MQKYTKCKKLLIEVNQTCNINCTYCFYRDYGRVKNFLNIEDIKKILEICPNADEFYLTGGECFTSPNIKEIINFLSKRGNVVIFTNGTILDSYTNEDMSKIVNNVNRFIISFDSFDFEKYECRDKLDKTYNTLNKIIDIDSNKLEVKVCITNQNKNKLDEIFSQLIKIGVKKISVNFVFDIQNSNIKHEVKDIKDLNNIFKTIYKYIDYFNKRYIDMLFEMYINNYINENYPCLADDKYLYYDCTGKLLICPGNCKKLRYRGNWKDCFSKECANEWEMMYDRGD